MCVCVCWGKSSLLVLWKSVLWEGMQGDAQIWVLEL